MVKPPYVCGIAALGASGGARCASYPSDGLPLRGTDVRSVAILGIVEIEVVGTRPTSSVEVAALAVAGVSDSLEGDSVLRNCHALVSGIRGTTDDEQPRDGIGKVGRGFEADIDIVPAPTLVHVLVNDRVAGIGQL